MPPHPSHAPLTTHSYVISGAGFGLKSFPSQVQQEGVQNVLSAANARYVHTPKRDQALPKIKHGTPDECSVLFCPGAPSQCFMLMIVICLPSSPTEFA